MLTLTFGSLANFLLISEFTDCLCVTMNWGFAAQLVNGTTLYDPLEQFEILLISERSGLSNLAVVLFFIFMLAFCLITSGTRPVLSNVYSYFGALIYTLVKIIANENLHLKRHQYFLMLFYLFITIFLSNLIGLIPYLFTPTSLFIMTFFLALGHFIGINFIATTRTRWETVGSPIYLRNFLKQVGRWCTLARDLIYNNFNIISLLSAGVTLVVFYCDSFSVFEIKQFLSTSSDNMPPISSWDAVSTNYLFDPLEPENGNPSPNQSKPKVSFWKSLLVTVSGFALGAGLTKFVFWVWDGGLVKFVSRWWGEGPSTPPSTPATGPATSPSNVPDAVLTEAPATIMSQVSGSPLPSLPSNSLVNNNLLPEISSNHLTQVINAPVHNGFSLLAPTPSISNPNLLAESPPTSLFQILGSTPPRSSSSNQHLLTESASNTIVQATLPSAQQTLISRSEGITESVLSSLTTPKACTKYIDKLGQDLKLPISPEERKVICDDMARVLKHRRELIKKDLYDPLEIDIWNWLNNVEDQTWVLLMVMLAIIVLFSFIIRYNRRQEKPAR